jgi:hypothetical protein
MCPIEILGELAARAVVSSCAQSEVWTATLSHLLLDPDQFRQRVYDNVRSRAYRILFEDIPASPDTSLADVVAAIQLALPGDPHTPDPTLINVQSNSISTGRKHELSAATGIPNSKGVALMAQVTISIAGVSHDASLTWNGTMIPLASTGGGNFAAAFQSSAGKFIYSIVVFGSPNDPWTAKVTDGTNTNNHAGVMSPGGYDTTGDTQFQVT